MAAAHVVLRSPGISPFTDELRESTAHRRIRRQQTSVPTRQQGDVAGSNSPRRHIGSSRQDRRPRTVGCPGPVPGIDSGQDRIGTASGFGAQRLRVQAPHNEIQRPASIWVPDLRGGNPAWSKILLSRPVRARKRANSVGPTGEGQIPKDRQLAPKASGLAPRAEDGLKSGTDV